MSQMSELAALIDRYATVEGISPSAIPRLKLVRVSGPMEPAYEVQEPALCVVAQGRKQLALGGTVYTYDPEHYLVVSMDVPVIGHAVDASPERPFLGIRLDFDPAAIGALAAETGLAGRADGVSRRSLGVSPLGPELGEAVVRLVRLLATPADAPVLAPLAEREVLYRVLTGEQGPRLRDLAHAEGRLQRVGRAIDWIKRNFARPLRIEDLAGQARMSPSALHHHFKQVTAMSPLQYQKQLRLQEARRLLLTGTMDAADAGYAVGYESPSQFSREYARLFGAPPRRDTERLRAAAAIK